MNSHFLESEIFFTLFFYTTVTIFSVSLLDISQCYLHFHPCPVCFESTDFPNLGCFRFPLPSPLLLSHLYGFSFLFSSFMIPSFHRCFKVFHSTNTVFIPTHTLYSFLYPQLEKHNIAFIFIHFLHSCPN